MPASAAAARHSIGPHAIIIAPADDLHALTVSWECERAGSRVVLLDSADFPSRWSITLEAEEGAAPRFDVVTPTGEIARGDELLGLWLRRTRPHEIDPQVDVPEQRGFCRAESAALFEGWIYALGRRVINPLAADLAARRKPVQLAVAQACGLRVPTTLVSSAPDMARAALSRHKADFVYKGLTSARFAMNETRPLDAETRVHLDGLALAPAILQRRVEGDIHLRVTVVDDAVFAAEVTSANLEAQIDWRLDPAIEIRPHAMSAETRSSIMSLQSELGLRYGAYDFRQDKEGCDWFLEVNPGGQYLFVEIDAGLPISSALARALASGSGQ